jgi:hypothetical protein
VWPTTHLKLSTPANVLARGQGHLAPRKHGRVGRPLAWHRILRRASEGASS